MAAFDRRLVRPSVHQLVEALQEAYQTARPPDGSAAEPPAWQPIVEDLRRDDEGFRAFRDSGVVTLAWWTDGLSRRHFRIRGCAAGDAEYHAVDLRAPDLRPPVWHVYPDRVFGAEEGELVTWHGVCPCGRAAPTSGGNWFGDKCHYCDRPWQGPPPRAAVDPLAPLAGPEGTPRLLTFSAFGTYLAVGNEEPSVDLWDVRDRSHHRRLDLPAAPRAMAFSTSGMALAVACDDRLLHVFDVDTLAETTSVPTPKGVRQVALGFNLMTVGLAGETNAEIWTRPNWTDGWQLTEDIVADSVAIAVHRNESWLALAAGTTLRVWKWDPARWTMHWMHREDGYAFKHVAFHPDQFLVTTRLDASATARKASWVEVNTWLRDCSVPHVARRLTPSGKLTLAPGGHWLGYLVGSTVCLEDTHRDHTRRFFGSPHATPKRLAISPDGQLVATIDADKRVRIWPVGRVG